MPRTKEVLRTYGTIVEELWTYKTDWVHMVGCSILRCDDAAKDGGTGAWICVGPRVTSHWNGAVGHIDHFDPANWLKDDHTGLVYSEQDYS